MKTKDNIIPQHPLVDAEGHSRDFMYSAWGDPLTAHSTEKPHRHSFYTIFFFHQGGGKHDIDFQTYKAGSRSIHFVAPDNVHLMLRNKNTKGCSLLFTENFTDKSILRELPFHTLNPLLRPDKETYKNLKRLVDEIETEFSGRESGYELMIQALMQQLFQKLIRYRKTISPVHNAIDQRPRILQDFIHLLENGIKSNLSVKEIAEKLNVSDKHLIDTCRKHTGKTPHKLIRESLVAEAKKLLFYSELSIKQIAYTLNFDDPANFSRYFKSDTGYSPQEYREGIR